jgi:hypothetical protein
MIKLPPLSIRMSGGTRPPDDLVAAAQKTLGPDFEPFLARYGAQFTHADLCAYLEEHRDGSRP